MAKAMKEAKLNTSWVQPNEAWDAAMADFVARILDPSPRNRFLASFIPVAEEIARLGAINSLSQILLKLTAPGRAGYLPRERDLGFQSGRSG